MSIALLTSIVLVFLLLIYLVCALINAEEF
ncbi:K(+)-transporting ATPase subunit F [Erwinia pyri]|uniref:K(+)-transporting ATPase subunit F n=1 Tax=Erwinia pyri TaxID=3062598 RepID=A0AA50HQT9_9GAMM|nr:K(+)-transporting ATPase subunit F [Erwinia sp. DE2]WLS79148.1 K(+)-transporting ATPase subunit F [Erwinia sp. DE2]